MTESQYEKSKATRLKNNPNAYRDMGKKSSGNPSPVISQDPEKAREMANKRWAKYKKEREDENNRQGGVNPEASTTDKK